LRDPHLQNNHKLTGGVAQAVQNLLCNREARSPAFSSTLFFKDNVTAQNVNVKLHYILITIFLVLYHFSSIEVSAPLVGEGSQSSGTYN
jgi:hypothetical protein